MQVLLVADARKALRVILASPKRRCSPIAEMARAKSAAREQDRQVQHARELFQENMK